jgi:hypothetical protein
MISDDLEIVVGRFRNYLSVIKISTTLYNCVEYDGILPSRTTGFTPD